MTARAEITVTEVQLSTVDLYPLPPVAQAIRQKVDEAFEELDEATSKLSPADIVDEEIERLFGPAPTAEWPDQFAALARLVLVTEQAAQNERALSYPHEVAMTRHKERADRFDRTVAAYRRKLAEKLQVIGGKFSDGELRMHIRRAPHLAIIGNCSVHDGFHYESVGCQDFTIAEEMIPRRFLKVTVEPRKVLIRLALKEGEPGIDQVAQVVEGPPHVVIK